MNLHQNQLVKKLELQHSPVSEPNLTDPGLSDFDALIANAPEESEIPEPPVTTQSPNPDSSPSSDSQEVTQEEPKKIDESFYEDPLIKSALAIFEGKLIK